MLAGQDSANRRRVPLALVVSFLNTVVAEDLSERVAASMAALVFACMSDANCLVRSTKPSLADFSESVSLWSFHFGFFRSAACCLCLLRSGHRIMLPINATITTAAITSAASWPGPMPEDFDDALAKRGLAVEVENCWLSVVTAVGEAPEVTVIGG